MHLALNRPNLTLSSSILSVLLTAASAHAQTNDLADHFGFGDLEIVKIGDNAGPAVVADMNNDGLNDIVVVNNFASRIEIHYQKKNATPDDEPTGTLRVNEFPEHWRYRRDNISVANRVSALIVYDFDGDGLKDIIYAGMPPEIVFLRQSSTGTFTVTHKHTVKDLAATRSAFAIADVLGDSKPELISLVKGEINIWPMDGDNLGQPTTLDAGSNLIAFSIDDFNGDGRQDIAGIIPEDSSPVRLWLGGTDHGKGTLGAENRFEMPALREFEPVHLPGHPGALMA
ncbi:MAG TPA: VCBS repeat-containing protein, partial [Phycisphaerales bacterium]|nr:VCBS repeat-containing protein [Phycisphaerales bacterium]